VLVSARHGCRDIVNRIVFLGPSEYHRRPPYGDVDNRIRTIAQGLNLSTIVWSQDTVRQGVQSRAPHCLRLFVVTNLR
jgi:hypothetical protein